ncbi:MAG: hypothetical protein PHR61_03865 [Candidatus Absconditabacteria bacterium]|nr:hypothetical protein [Candidatus Absconditabacteria bacterium]
MKNEKENDQEQMVLRPREEFDLLSNKSGRKEPQKEEIQEEDDDIKKFFKDKGDNL